MWEILGELAVLCGDGPVRALRARRAHRELLAGLPVRIPCSARSEKPGWPAEYVSGSLLFTPGRATAAFGSRAFPYLEFPVGGSHHAPEPDAWHDQDWAALGYREPDDGPVLYLQVHSRYLITLELALRRV